MSKFKSFVAIGMVALAGYGVVNYNASKEASSSKDSSVNISTEKVSNSTNLIEEKQSIQEMKSILVNVNGLSEAQIEELNNVSRFTLKDGLSNNQVSRSVAQLQREKTNYLQSLISEAEGFRSYVYNDNIGYAFGNGWNLSMHSKQENNKIASLVSNDNSFITKVSGINNNTMNGTQKYIEPNAYSINISPQQSMAASTFMSYDFKDGVVKALNSSVNEMKKDSKIKDKLGSKTGQDVFNELGKNEQAALVYHTYKVGTFGVTKYKELLKNVVKYSMDKTDENKSNVVGSFTYKYKLNGEIKEDIRASVLVGSMFADKDAYGKFIGQNVAYKADKIKSLMPQLAKYEIKMDDTITIDNVPDPIGKIKEEMRNNKSFSIEFVAPQDVKPTLEEKPTKKMSSSMLIFGMK